MGYMTFFSAYDAQDEVEFYSDDFQALLKGTITHITIEYNGNDQEYWYKIEVPEDNGHSAKAAGVHVVQEGNIQGETQET